MVPHLPDAATDWGPDVHSKVETVTTRRKEGLVAQIPVRPDPRSERVVPAGEVLRPRASVVTEEFVEKQVPAP